MTDQSESSANAAPTTRASGFEFTSAFLLLRLFLGLRALLAGLEKYESGGTYSFANYAKNMGGMATCMDLRLEEGAGRLAKQNVLMLLDRPADVFLARRSGADGWVIKPIDPLRVRKAARAVQSGGTFHDQVAASA